MENSPPIPAAISHRQLQTLLQEAPQDPIASEAAAAPDEALQAALEAWSRSSRQLLAQLQQLHQAPAGQQSPRQLMALGALQAHVAMGLQALAHSRGQRD